MSCRDVLQSSTVLADEGQFVSWRCEIQKKTIQVSKFGQRLQCLTLAIADLHFVQILQMVRHDLQQSLGHGSMEQEQRAERFAGSTQQLQCEFALVALIALVAQLV